MPFSQGPKVTVTRSLATFYTPGEKSLTAKFLFSTILQAQNHTAGTAGYDTPACRKQTTHLEHQPPNVLPKTFVIDMMGEDLPHSENLHRNPAAIVLLCPL